MDWILIYYKFLNIFFRSGEITEEVIDAVTADQIIITIDQRELPVELCHHCQEKSGLTVDTGTADLNNLQDTAVIPASI